MTMRITLSLVILITSVIAVGAQRTTKMVFWSGDAECGIKNRFVTKDDKISCSSVPTDRGPVSTITHNGVDLSVAFIEDDDYHVVGAGITNHTTEPVFFDADFWGAAHFKNKSSAQERQKPIAAETSIPSREILRSLATGVRNESSLDTFIADGQKTNETKEMRRSDGTRYRVDVVVPDKDAQAAAARQNSDRATMVMKEQSRIRATALTAKSVRPESSVKGLVYFKRIKEAEFVIFSLSVADTTYVFQLPRVKK